MKRGSSLQVAFDLWGPIKITVDKQARELWGKPSRESLRKAFITLRGHGVRTKSSLRPLPGTKA